MKGCVEERRIFFIYQYKGVGIVFKISEQIKHKDLDMYKKLKNSFKPEKKPKKDVELGDRPENLMKQNSYKRIGRRIRQTKWSD